MTDEHSQAFLLTPAAQELLAELRADRDSSVTEVHRVETLRKRGLSADQVSLLLGQTELRRRARAKFGALADQLLFTEAGLEQATRLSVARTHAKRFHDAGVTQVTDLGCGIGAETLALAEAGLTVRAVENDPLTAHYAGFNVRNFPLATVSCADALTTDIPPDTGVFLDPARRTAGTRETRRITNIDEYTPPLTFAFDLAQHFPTAVKLGPGFPREHIPDSAHAQWTSVNGDAVEMMLWFGELATSGVTRSALVLQGDRSYELTAPHDSPDVDTRALGDYLFEPDPAVIRARLIGDLARSLGLGMVDERIAYLTGDSPVSSPFVQAFRIDEQLPASESRLKRLLRERNIGELEIKKRGMDVDPAALRKRLQLRGDERATLILTRAADKRMALLCTRQNSATHSD